ncbi:MAG: polysaccharide pyruvyl transferase CsaB [Candidatus Saganbacteria bacterium]|uniref:Polysaccharide pyruvyl transferase CsaB n=1 Tax=Candidatus Saganbacteria bacterium TaxID=2575572 RepID=A0A833L179_UNCSA|nr:MAG: polysaccharide pyruvyl transferase CsaB [Candidatus Saganbacteria bacterium]
MKIAVSGYYGFDNTGDEAILEAIKSGINQNNIDAEIVVLDKNNRFNVDYILKSDVLLSGGGSLLQDSTSTRSFLYYLSIIKIAKVFGKKIFVFAQGIGPITKSYNEFLLKNTLNSVDLITVRDVDSFNYLKSLKLSNPKIVETADPTFILNPEKDSTWIKQEGIVLNKKPLIGVILRSIKKNKPNPKYLANIFDKMANDLKAQLLFIPFQYPQDISFVKQVYDNMLSKPAIIFRKLKPKEIMGIISEMDLIIGMRLHSLMFAANCLVPAIGLTYDPKVDSFMEEVSLPYLPYENFKGDDLISMAEDMLDNKDKIVNSLKLAKRRLYAKAMTNFGMLNLLL